VLDDAVIQVEAAGPKQDARDCLPQRATSGAPSLDQQHQPDNQRGGRAEMKDAVGNQSGGLATPVIEVVPAQQLVQNDLVQAAGHTDPVPPATAATGWVCR